jgi:glycosyltransferase involved in cell wall biosynthesis
VPDFNSVLAEPTLPTIAYLANQFPSPVEPYVMEEIQELRSRGVEVVPCSARLPETLHDPVLRLFSLETLYLEPLQLGLLLRAVGPCLKNGGLLLDLAPRILWNGSESPALRIRTLLHSWLGAYFSLLLRRRGVEHIHVHHGYFASWIALIAARLLGISFSMTLHGSDLLLHPRYLETKLRYCKFCITISEFNRTLILKRYPQCDPGKILVQRLGVSTPNCLISKNLVPVSRLTILAVGRLHPVKDHAFLLQACRRMKDRGISFACEIAGEGEERTTLEQLICLLDLESEVRLLGHLSRQHLHVCYANSNLVVLTSRSEGIPLVLMEAMSHGKVVLAPAITGIPELLCDGQTGFLYQPGSLESFVDQVELISRSQAALGRVQDAARQHVLGHFNREKNLAAFGDTFLERIGETIGIYPYENPVLQQI